MTPRDWDLLRELDPAEQAALAEMRLNVLSRVERRRAWPPYLAAAAAVLIAVFLGIPRMPPAESLSLVVPAPRAPEVRLTAVAPPPRARAVPKPGPTEPFVLKLVTADPDVIIYLVSNGAAE